MRFLLLSSLHRYNFSCCQAQGWSGQGQAALGLFKDAQYVLGADWIDGEH